MNKKECEEWEGFNPTKTGLFNYLIFMLGMTMIISMTIVVVVYLILIDVLP